MDNKKGFTVIQEWMLDFDLNASELLAYATIYGYSQNGISKYEGSRSYLAKRSACSLSTIKRILVSLEEKGLIEKESVEHPNKLIECRYKAVVQNEPTGVKMNQGVVQNEPGAIVYSNIYNTIEEKKEENKDIYKEPASPKKLPANKFFISSTERAAVLNDPDKIAELKRSQFYERTRYKAKELGMTKEVFLDFVGYWCEHSDGSERLRCEKEETFSITQRIQRWLKNNRITSSSPQPPRGEKNIVVPHAWTQEEIDNLYK